LKEEWVKEKGTGSKVGNIEEDVCEKKK
jgi:hypothetical protein